MGHPEQFARYGPNAPAVIAFLDGVLTATRAEIEGIDAAFDWANAGVSAIVSSCEKDLTAAAYSSGLEEAVRHAYFDGLAAGVATARVGMNAEYFYEFFWNSRVEARFAEAAGMAAAAIALGDALSRVTAGALLDPWGLG